MANGMVLIIATLEGYMQTVGTAWTRTQSKKPSKLSQI